MAKHTIQELQSMQAAPLSVKVLMTAERIRNWVNEFGEDGVYLSFSGGKDSTVLGHIIREVCGYKNIPFVFVDVPTQYPELKQFAKTFDNLVILKPKISFADFGIFDNERPLLKTTGCQRTGCVLCGFGCHLEKESRFLRLKETHPKFHNLLYVLKNNGVTYAEAIDWVNEHGNMNIKY